MYVSEVALKRNINLGNYESVHAEVHVTLNEGDDAQEAFNMATFELNAELRKKESELRGKDIPIY